MYFFQVSGNPLRKRKLYKMKVVIQNSALRGYQEFYVKLQKDLAMLMLAVPIVLLIRVILYSPYVRLKVHC